MPRSSHRFLLRFLSVIIIIVCDYSYISQGLSYSLIAKNMGVYSYYSYWILRAYNLGIIITALIGGPIVEKVGKRKMILASLSVILATITLASLSVSISQLILLRTLQGFASGFCLNAAMKFFIDTFPKNKVNPVVNLTFGVSIFSIVMGLWVGSYVPLFWGWQWTFIIPIPITAVLLAMSYFYYPKKEDTKDQKLDFIFVGAWITFLSSSYYTILYFFLKHWDSPSILLSSSIAITSLVVGILFAYKRPSVFIDLSLFRNRYFLLAILLTLSVGLVYSNAVSEVFRFLSSTLNANFVSEAQAATLVIAAMSITSYFATKLLKYNIPILAFILTGIACYYIYGYCFSNITQQVSLPIVTLFGIIGNIGCGLIFVAAQQLAVKNVEPEKRSMAKTIVRVVFRSFYALMICSNKTLTSLLQVQNYNDMRGEINAYNTNVNSYLNAQIHNFMQQGYDSQSANISAITSLSRTLKSEALLCSYVQNGNAIKLLAILLLFVTLGYLSYSLIHKQKLSLSQKFTAKNMSNETPNDHDSL